MDATKTVEVVTIHTDGVPIVLRFPEADLPQPYRSAPELLEALRATLEHAEDETAIRAGAQCTLCHSYRQMIRAAIAAATGEG